MKLLALLAFFLALATLSGCAGTITKDAGSGAVTVNVSAGTLEVATHKDLIAAAAVATNKAAATADPMLQAALLARAARWLAADKLLRGIEDQASVCGNAILAMKPQVSPLPSGAGIFTKAEILAEDVGSFQGVTPAVKLACTDFPPLILPKLPVP
jgi:uncharacterized protein YceK